ncbi:D-alanyl-D-alanine carboxypeptidase [Streptomyces sp. NPDC047108]|uniref:D-alanyl-D-alanine carboxypeptidase n=1 Tax=Streptomyces sp. NPDC047108 TaxID=3155025 RepID=UPI0033EA3E49
MAGESPEKSEQGKSSGETARREDGREHERDPRLAYGGSPTSEKSAAGAELTDGAAGEDATGAGADGAVATEADGESAGAADREAAEESTEDSARGSAADSAGGSGADQRDARLRAAVAAWVASADEGGAGDADDEGAGGGDANGDGTADTADAEAGTEDAADADAGERAADDGEPEDESAASAASDLPKRPVDRATTSLSTLPERPEASGDGADDEPVDRPTSVFATRPPAEREGKSGGDKGAEPEAGTGGTTAESRADAAEAAADRGAVDQATSVFRTLPRSGGDEASGTNASGTKASGTKASGTAKSGQDGAAERSAGDADVPERPVDQPTAVFKAPEPRERDEPSGTARNAGDGRSAAGKTPSADESGSGKSPEGQGSRGEKSETSEKSKDVDGAPKNGDRPERDAPAGRVDQATTAFKAVRTKAGDSGKGDATGDGGATARTGNGADGPEPSAAERTSRFVPLKSADDAPRKPPSAAVAAEGDAEAEAGVRSEAASAAAEGKAGAVPEAKSATSSEAKAAAPEAKSAASGATAAAPEAKAAPSRPGEAPAQPGESPRPPGAPALPESERTKQEPVPDPAPLELLAQLTNTPPPPETPLRNAVRRVKIWTPLAVLLAIVFAIAQAVRPLPEPTLTLTATQAYEFDGAKPSMPWPDSGQAAVGVDGLGSFGTFGEQKPVPIASVAKTMTAYVILKEHPLKPGSQGSKIPVDRKAEEDAGLGAQNESVVETEEGETLTEYEALNAIMIASANNVARLLARWDAGSEKAFVKKMNDAAKDLGMKNTTYTDPSGLEATTVSTAEDQVKLGRKVMQDPVFREVVAKPSYKDRNGKKQDNWNRLVPFSGVGIKTGTSTAAQGNLLFAAQKKVGGTTQLIIGAVLRQPPDPSDNSILTGAVEASKPLITSAGDALTSRKVVKKGDVVGHVDDGLGGTTPVVATKDVSAVGWTGLTVDIALTDNGKVVPHEAKAGTKVGTMTVGSGLGQVKVPIALQKDLMEPGFGDKLARIT